MNEHTVPLSPDPDEGFPPTRLVGAGSRSGRDRLEDAARALRATCVVWAALWTLGLVMNNVVGPLVSPDRPLDDAFPWPANPVAFACILLSAALFVRAGRPGVRPERLVDLALGYEVALALGIGIVNQWTPNSIGLSWICVLILVHPLIVPAPPGKVLAASLAAASMDLVGLAVSGARGSELPPASVIVWTYLPNFLCAGLAVLPSHVRARLEHHRGRARELGSYRLEGRLGSGGMGEVYRAEHRMLARPAAIKLVRFSLLGGADEDERRRVLRRFEREARATARLRSPHTVHVYDFGTSEDGTFYYVMELLDGLDLEVLVRRFGPIPPERVVHVLLQACDSLAEAHESGLVHRDVKPSNIHVCRYGRRVDFVKVLDFGLVKPTGLGDGDATLTGETTVTGTPACMAPELVLKTSPVDGRTDLYALGCVAYWLLTGRTVFEGRNALEVLGRHTHERPTPPSRRTELAVPEALDRAILSCLEKDPDRRPRDADALARLLSECELERAWTPERARKWWDLHLREGGPRNPVPEPVAPESA